MRPPQVRSPALEVIDTIRSVDLSRMSRPLKFVLWGALGTGKTMALAHVRHFLRESPDVIVANFGCARLWLHKHYGVSGGLRRSSDCSNQFLRFN